MTCSWFFILQLWFSNLWKMLSILTIVTLSLGRCIIMLWFRATLVPSELLYSYWILARRRHITNSYPYFTVLVVGKPHPSPRPCITFCNILRLFTVISIRPLPNPIAGGPPPWAVPDRLCSIFTRFFVLVIKNLCARNTFTYVLINS